MLFFADHHNMPQYTINSAPQLAHTMKFAQTLSLRRSGFVFSFSCTQRLKSVEDQQLNGVHS